MKVSEYKNLPESSGVYLMKDKNRRIIYIGKAGNLRRRVSSYFLKAHDSRISKMVSEIKTIDFLVTLNALEALVLEARLVKQKSPPYNIKEKDDKSFLYIEITDENFPRVLLVRGKSKIIGERFGPFTSASSVRSAMKILRRIFPWHTHEAKKIGTLKKPCFDYDIGLCPGTCVSLITRREYMKNIRNLKMFLTGKTEKLLISLKKEMIQSARKLNFEEAEIVKKKIFALTHVQDSSLLSETDSVFSTQERIESYDISNISGDSAVGAMVVFTNGTPDKDEYRKFKIRLLNTPNDVGMIKEIISRRLKNSWPLPSLILVDGGLHQVNAAKNALAERGLQIPVIGMIKGEDRKRIDLTGDYIQGIDKKILESARDEAHRFAISYHKSLRSKKFLKRE